MIIGGGSVSLSFFLLFFLSFSFFVNSKLQKTEEEREVVSREIYTRPLSSICYDLNQNPEIVQGIDKFIPLFSTFVTSVINSKLPIIVNKGAKIWSESTHIGFPIFCTLDMGVDSVQVQTLSINFLNTTAKLTHNVTSQQLTLQLSISSLLVSFRGFGNCGAFHPTVPGTLKLSGYIDVTLSECFNSTFFLHPSAKILDYLSLSAVDSKFTITGFELHYDVHEDNPVVKKVISHEIDSHQGDIRNAIVGAVRSNVSPAINKELETIGIKPFNGWQKKGRKGEGRKVSIISN